MLLERAIALDPTSIEALEALEQVTTELNDFERLADVLERKLQVAARGPVEQQELLGRLVQIYSGPGVPPRTRPHAARTPGDDRPRDDADGPDPAAPDARRRAADPRRTPATRRPRQAAAHAAAGKSAEAGGDLERAEQAYWRAASIEAEPALRANYLVAHARVLLARGDVQTARGQLEAARERAPGHVGRQRAAGRRQLPHAGLEPGARSLHVARGSAGGGRHRPARKVGPSPRRARQPAG